MTATVLSVIALIVSLVSPAAALIGIRLTLEHQRRQARAQDERNLRDARAARARQALGKLLAIALQMVLAADEPIMTTQAQRDELRKLLDQIGAMWPEMLQARAEILSEPNGEQWTNEFETLALQPFQEWRRVVGDADSSPREGRAALQALKNGVAQFRATVAGHLAELERPI